MSAMAQGRLVLTFPSHAEAQAAEAALRPDNAGHLRSAVDGADLTLEAEANSPMGLLRTFDDALACLRAIGLA